jgi:Peptidase inhibitor I78 family
VRTRPQRRPFHTLYRRVWDNRFMQTMLVRLVPCATILLAGAWGIGCSTTDRMTTPSSVEGPRQSGPSAPSQRPPSSPAPPAAPPDTTKCDASKAGLVIGSQATDEVLERARTAAGASVARFLKPNQPITMEYLESRLNLGLDDKNIVRSVRCG